MVIYYGDLTTMILKALLCRTMTYKQVEKMIQEHRGQDNTSSASVRSTLYRLRKKGLVTKTATGWRAITESRDPAKPRQIFSINYYERPRKNKPSTKQMIIIYDIPEHLKSTRDRLRLELQQLGFKMEQQSVWLGPAPLPKEFVKSLKKHDLIKYMKFFPVRKGDVI